LDVILYGGDWHGGCLRLPQLDLEVNLQSGDIVVMDSVLFHCVIPFAGERISLVFFTKRHNKVSKKKSKLEVPEELAWLNLKNFGIF